MGGVTCQTASGVAGPALAVAFGGFFRLLFAHKPYVRGAEEKKMI